MLLFLFAETTVLSLVLRFSHHLQDLFVMLLRHLLADYVKLASQLEK